MLRQSLLALLLVSPLVAEKRPLTHADYDAWRHIQNQQLSNDGHYLAYAVFPQVGDGELIVRDLVTGKQIEQPIGELPPPPPTNYANPQVEETPPPPPGIAVRFSADSRTLVFSTFAPHEQVEKAKREKRKPEDMPKGDLVVIDLHSGDLRSAAVFRAPRIKNFQVPAKGNGYIAYLQFPEKPSGEKAAIEQPAQNKPSDAAQPKPKKIEIGDVVLRNLKDGTERRFPDVTDYSLTKDAQVLVYAVQSHQPQLSGVYALRAAAVADPVALLSGKGKYEKLAWDEDQTRLAFVSDRDDAAARRPRFALYDWDRKQARANELVSSKTAGFPNGWVVSDKATITLSKDGNRIFFGTAPAGAGSKAPRFHACG